MSNNASLREASRRVSCWCRMARPGLSFAFRRAASFYCCIYNSLYLISLASAEVYNLWYNMYIHSTSREDSGSIKRLTKAFEIDELLACVVGYVRPDRQLLNHA